VSGPYLATLLTQKLGYPIVQGEPYYVPGCTKTTCVLPNATIPLSAWSAPAQKMLQYIPAPNVNGGYATSAFNQVVRDDKGAVRIDGDSRFGLLSAYYFVDDSRPRTVALSERHEDIVCQCS
jgi:hypothetical protein